MVTKKLIEKYFTGVCEPDEAEAVSDYLYSHPDVVEQYMSEEEWEQFVSERHLYPEQSERIWKGIYRNTGRPVLYYMKRASVAAAFLILIASAWMIWSKRGGQQELAVTSASHLILKENNSSAAQSFSLSDGSIIKLLPGSTVRYADTFAGLKRDIFLNGEAVFIVAKDPSKPFSVYSEGIVTVAMGTQFLVQAFSDRQTISVELFEGHVVVKPADSLNKSLNREIYLVPGDVLTYDKTLYTASVFNRMANKSTATSEPKTDKDIKTPGETLQGNNWYMFNNQALPEVFRQLEILYNQKIFYSASDVAGMTFIGKLDKSDSLHHILQAIAYLNNLKLSREKDGYHISK